MSSGACGLMRHNARNLTNLFDSEFVFKKKIENLLYFLYLKNITAHTGAAWLSSARTVRSLVNSNNERNPYF